MDVNEKDVFEEFSAQTETEQTIKTEQTETATSVDMHETVDTVETLDTVNGVDAEITFPLPETDYRKNGELKTVRGRMIKKLLKYEFRAIMPALYLCLGLLFGITVLACVVFNLPSYENEALSTLLILTVILYVYGVLATVIVPFIVSIHRYEKHFFKDEGYLTFSIPASAEEHILAKHVSGAVAALIGIAASIISVLIVINVAPFMDIFEGELEGIPMPETNLVSDIFETIEIFILGLVTIVGVFCVAGALTCWGQKFTKKGPMILRIVVAYIVFMVIETLAMTYCANVLVWFETDPVGLHVGNVLMILLYSAISVLCVVYQLHILKRKLNLK